VVTGLCPPLNRRCERVDGFAAAGIHDVGSGTPVRTDLCRRGLDAGSILVGTDHGCSQRRHRFGERLADP
jgi:hypothetical protein